MALALSSAPGNVSPSTDFQKSGQGGWSQPVDATLYLRGKRWSVGWNGDFIEVLLRQRRRSYGIAGSQSGQADRKSYAIGASAFSAVLMRWGLGLASRARLRSRQFRRRFDGSAN